MNKTAIALLALLASSVSLAATPWQKITQPVPGSAQSIGSFSNGCIVGADTLPIQSEHYQVMRTDQRRYFGHPDLVMFIQRLSSQVSNLGMGTVLIGDMGMPAGGRFNGGHASHQTGLDVDIFLQLPKTRWTSAQLLRPQALDLVSRDGCAKCDPGSSIVRICMYDYVVLPIVWSVKINLYRHQAMVAGQNCKAGLNLQNREQQSLRRRHRLRCRLPARRYWMST